MCIDTVFDETAQFRMEKCVAERKNHNFDSNTLSYISFFQFLIGTADYLSFRGGDG